MTGGLPNSQKDSNELSDLFLARFISCQVYFCERFILTRTKKRKTTDNLTWEKKNQQSKKSKLKKIQAERKIRLRNALKANYRHRNFRLPITNYT